MNLLLDTPVWWRGDAHALGTTAHRALLDEGNTVHVGAAVGWEIVIERSLGKLVFDGSVAAAVAEEGSCHCRCSCPHLDELARLPEHHRDPFDRAWRWLARSSTDPLADEPTGNLDSETQARVLDLLRAVPARGAALVVVTHNGEVAAIADRTLTPRDGRLLSDTAVPRAADATAVALSDRG